AQQRTTDGRLVRDPPVGGSSLCGADDHERLLAILALDGNRRADLDVVARVVLVDERGVLDERLERLDPALDEGLLVLGVLVLGVLGQIAVFLCVVDARGDLGPTNVRHLLVLGLELLEAFAGEIGWLVHSGSPPFGWVGFGWSIWQTEGAPIEPSLAWAGGHWRRPTNEKELQAHRPVGGPEVRPARILAAALVSVKRPCTVGARRLEVPDLPRTRLADGTEGESSHPCR